MPIGIMGVSSGTSGVLPSQTGNSGEYLTTDGTNASWASIAAGKDVKVASTTWTSAFSTTNGSYQDVTNATITLSGLTAAKTYTLIAFSTISSLDIANADTARVALIIDSTESAVVGNGETANLHIGTSLTGAKASVTGSTSYVAKLQLKSGSGFTSQVNYTSQTCSITLMAVEA